ncbi:MAG: enoyl-CoA hydratase-related protein [Desulfatiglandaceae bacterium]
MDRSTPQGKVMDAALALATRIIKRGPLGVAAAKKVLNRTKDMVLQPGLELEADFWAGLSATRDMKEGARAFIEKRKPTWESK